MIEFLLFFKSLHIIGAIAWFGGLFYLVRMFVYHVEALDKEEPDRTVLREQFELMEHRVYYIICIPAMLITWIFGSLIVAAYYESQGFEWFRINSWLHIKIFLVVLLSGYQHYCKKIMIQLKEKQGSHSSSTMRLLNEVPTLFLVAIVLFAVYRNTLNSMYALIGITIFGILLYFGVRNYKRLRKKSA